MVGARRPRLCRGGRLQRHRGVRVLAFTSWLVGRSWKQDPLRGGERRSRSALLGIVVALSVGCCCRVGLLLGSSGCGTCQGSPCGAAFGRAGTGLWAGRALPKARRRDSINISRGAGVDGESFGLALRRGCPGRGRNSGKAGRLGRRGAAEPGGDPRRLAMPVGKIVLRIRHAPTFVSVTKTGFFRPERKIESADQ